MQRRSFLKLIGAVIIAPSLPVLPVKPALEAGWFMYRGFKFRKNIIPRYSDAVQIYTEVEICGERYCDAILIDKDDYKSSVSRKMFFDNMIHAIKSLSKQRIESRHNAVTV